LVLFDPARSRYEATGAVQMIPGYGKKVERVVADELYAGSWPKFVHPWPLSSKYFLASARVHPDQVEYAVYLVDIFDNITQICTLPDHSLLEPIPLKARQAPPVIPDRVRPGAQDATVFLADVHQGPGLHGAPRGSVKRLRLFTYNYVYRDTIRRGFGHLATPGVDGPWEPRYLLGTVPVRPDGSALFTVPANVPLSVQPLDAEGRALQQMRSWFTAMPGEVLSCVGCHEPQGTAPPAYLSRAPLEAPDRPEPWHGPPRGFDFELEVQPVLDRYCVGCHDGSEPARPDFARKPESEKLRINTEYHRATESSITTLLTPSFIALHPYVRRPHAESHYNPQVAAEFFADTSPLVQMLTKGHHNVQLDAEAWDRLTTWIDLGAPDQGSWKNSEWGTPANYHERRLEMLRDFANRTDDVEWLPPPPDQPPAFTPPPREEKAQGRPTCPNWPFEPAEALRRQEALGLPKTIRLDVANGLTMELALIPPGEFVLGDPDGPRDERPAARVALRKPFYLSRHEVTNAQFAALGDPNHFSGFVSWRSIDWRGEGHPLFAPTQPAVRLSWTQAMAFCQALSAKVGKTASLPTEAQWEWACRAGSDSPLWFGGLDTDFSPFENLAGREQRGFAFAGKPKWYLRDDRFDDHAMVAAAVGSYRPNPWGLCDMAGNVSEWTRTAYRPYPYDPADERDQPSPEGDKVVRGGSWDDKPNRARSAFRWRYPAWRRVYNVGFRVVVELD
jgi:formylglycine-generating enzyme required for sulfatase activity